MSTRTRFEKEAKGNSEMAYFALILWYKIFMSHFSTDKASADLKRINPSFIKHKTLSECRGVGLKRTMWLSGHVVSFPLE